MVKQKEYLIESIVSGRYLKITAVDPETGIEASVLGPANNAAKKELTSLAIKKLQYVISKTKKT